MSTASATMEAPKNQTQVNGNANGNGSHADSTAPFDVPKKTLWHGIDLSVVGVTGKKGSGKTLFISSIDPTSTYMIDLEDSSRSYNLPFKKTTRLYGEMVGKTQTIPKPIQVFEWFRELLFAIKPGEFSVLAVDPINDVEQGLTDWVQSHPEYFNRTKEQYQKAMALMLGDVNAYWKMLLGVISNKVQTFAFTTHIGLVFKDGKPVPGKEKAKGKGVLYELASMYLWLQRDADAQSGKVPDKPTAVTVMPYGKVRLALSTIDQSTGEVTHRPILPPRMEGCTPHAIREKIKAGGTDYSKLKKHECVQHESFSEDEKLVMQVEISENNRIAAEANVSRLEKMKQAAEQQAAMRERQNQNANAALASGASNQSVSLAAPVATTAANAPASTTGKSDPIRQELNALQVLEEIRVVGRKLNVSEEALQSIAAKRGAKSLGELPLDQLLDIRTKLSEKLAAKSPAGN